jgi:GntR family transcriptional regulator, histidine utilization repressor
MLNPDSTVPLYRQIQERIRRRIADGEWRPGRKIPSENELVGQWGVSRMTVHRALRELAQEGHLERVAGLGTFVAEPPRRASLMELKDIAEEVRAAGAEHHARLCSRRRVSLDATAAAAMERPVGTEAAHVILIHYRDDLPIQHEERWVDLEMVPDFLQVDFETVTPSQHLLQTLPAEEVEHVVEAILPTPAVAAALAIEPTAPCLRLERRTWSGGRVVTFAVLTYPGSRYVLGARCAPAPGTRSPR